MDKNQKQRLMEVIQNNLKWPIILDGVGCELFSGSIVLDARIPSNQLGVISTQRGFLLPTWLKELRQKSKKLQRVLLIISNLDEVVTDEQEKFYGILKYKGINGCAFGENVQILIPIKKGTINKISEKIQSVSLLYKVN